MNILKASFAYKSIEGINEKYYFCLLMKPMIMRKIILTVFLALIMGTLAHGQIDKEIAGFVDSTEQLAENGKLLLLKALEKGDLNKSKEIYHYLDQKVNNRRYSAFSFTEELYVLLLTNQLDLWIDRARKSRLYLSKLIYPSVEDFSNDFYYLLKDRLPFAESSIERSNFEAQDKDMLNVFITLISEGAPGDRYKKELKSFKQKYSITEYKYFIDLYLPRTIKKLSYSYILGGTSLIPTGTMANTLDAGSAFMIDFSITVERYYFGFYAAAGNMPLKADIKLQLTMTVHFFIVVRIFTIRTHPEDLATPYLIVIN
jgi:hypothetical protein